MPVHGSGIQIQETHFFARILATVLLPAPAGPSIAMIISGSPLFLLALAKIRSREALSLVLTNAATAERFFRYRARAFKEAFLLLRIISVQSRGSEAAMRVISRRLAERI